MLVEVPFGKFPMALGVLYDDPRPTFEVALHEQNRKASEGKRADLAGLLTKGQTWTVGGTAAEPIGTTDIGQGGPDAAPRGRI
jgi:2-oxoglutarate/2-oxoacid ferredoxin oxidoreductase subunit beta